MAKSQKTIPPKLKSLEKLEALLEILNEQSDRYVPDSELKTKFKEHLNPNKKLDDTALENSFNNTKVYALGINDKVGRPKTDTPQYLAAVAQIWQTKLIDLEQFDINGKKENCYMITIRGIEVLNHLRNSRHSKGLLESSRRLEILTFVLIAFTGYLIVYSVASIIINCKGESACYTYPLEVGFGTVIVIAILVFMLHWLCSKLGSRWNRGL